MNIVNLCFKIYRKIQGVMVPGLRYSQEMYEDALHRYVTPQTAWLDLGCGHQILPDWRGSEERKLVDTCKLIVGVDADLSSLQGHRSISLRVSGNMSRLPLKSESFDLVTANMVVEHLNEPDVQFREIYRVLKPGGVFLFHTVNIFGYYVLIAKMIPERFKKRLVLLFEGRVAEDVYPTCYRANSRKKIEALAKFVGFASAEVKPVASSAKFVIVPPMLIPELLWIRLTMTKRFRWLRTNIIAMLEK